MRPLILVLGLLLTLATLAPTAQADPEPEPQPEPSGDPEAGPESSQEEETREGCILAGEICVPILCETKPLTTDEPSREQGEQNVGPRLPVLGMYLLIICIGEE